MSIERQFRRFADRKKRKRTVCKKCRSKLCDKPGYGIVCPECGWELKKEEMCENQGN